MTIEERVIGEIDQLLSSTFDMRAKIAPTDDLVHDLGADSLDLVELLMTIEENFDIEISDEDEEKLKTVQDVIDCVRRRGLK